MPPPTDPFVYRNTFHQLLADKRCLDAVYEAIIVSEADALNDRHPGDLSNHRGLMAFLRRDRRLCAALRPLGWTTSEESRQRRILAPAGLYGVNLQLLHSRAEITQNRAFTNAKGEATVELIGENYRMCSGQTSLFDDMQHTDPKIAIWVLSMLSRDDTVRVALLLPETISECRRILTGSRFFDEFPRYNLTHPGAPLGTLPEGVDIDFPAIIDREWLEDNPMEIGEDL